MPNLAWIISRPQAVTYRNLCRHDLHRSLPARPSHVCRVRSERHNLTDQSRPAPFVREQRPQKNRSLKEVRLFSLKIRPVPKIQIIMMKLPQKRMHQKSVKTKG